jgi:hypothetical protein
VAGVHGVTRAFTVISGWFDYCGNYQRVGCSSYKPAAARERLATILITLANQGLRDPDELQATAVAKFVLE